VGKANISFPEGMLETVDQRSESSGTTRSAFIQEAISRYLADLDRDLARVVRVDRIEQAILGMREIGLELPGGTDGVALLRQLRDATPVWLRERDLGDE
jgi:predicted DNA-binding protein